MNSSDVKRLVINDPAILALSQSRGAGGVVVPGIEAAKIAKQIDALVPVVVDDILMHYDWDFAYDETTQLTSADTGEYTLPGNNDDCRHIWSIRWWDQDADDDNFTLLKKRSRTWMDDYRSRNSITTVQYWVPNGRTDKAVKVIIFDSPEDANETLKYRYLRADIGISGLPDEFLGLLVVGVKAKLLPRFIGEYNAVLSSYVGRFETVGPDPDPAPIDETWRTNNRNRAELMGW